MIPGPLGHDWLKLERTILWLANPLIVLDVHTLMVAAHRSETALEEARGRKVAKRVVHRHGPFVQAGQMVQDVIDGLLTLRANAGLVQQLVDARPSLLSTVLGKVERIQVHLFPDRVCQLRANCITHVTVICILEQFL